MAESHTAFEMAGPRFRDTLTTLARIAAVILIFVIFDRGLGYVTRMPVEAYDSVSILLAFVQTRAVFFGAMLAGLVVLAVFGNVLSPWSKLCPSAKIRGFVLALAVLLTWPFATYGYNFHADQFHLIDRLALVLCCGLIWVRPVFVFPFLLTVLLIMWQIAAPGLGGTVLAHKLLVVQCLMVFAAWLLVRSVHETARIGELLFVICCLVAGRYWEAGLAKVQLGWFDYGHLSRALISAHAHGWLSQLDSGEIVRLSQYFIPFDLIMRSAVIVVETGAIVFLLSRKLSLALICAFIVFHLGVFVLLGFLFWTWIGVLVALGVVLARPDDDVLEIYRPLFLAVSIPLIAGASFWNRPPHLGWFDTRLAYVYRLEVVGASGAVYTVNPRDMAPYGDVFTMAPFQYLANDHATLTGPYAVGFDKEMVEAVDAATTAEDVLEIESARDTGQRGSPEQQRKFYAFVAQYFSNRNSGGGSGFLLKSLRPPAQFWSFGWENPYKDQELVKEVIVKELTFWFDGTAQHLIRETELNRLAIAGPEAEQG